MGTVLSVVVSTIVSIKSWRTGLTFVIVLFSLLSLSVMAESAAQATELGALTVAPAGELMDEAGANYQVVDVGVLAIRGYKGTINRWQPLMGWLESQIPNSYFRLHPLSLEELAKGVETEGLDFVITNPGQSVMLARQYSLSWLATLRSPINNGAAMQVGSALVVRADSPYQTLKDLKGKRLGIVSKNAFGGYLTMVYEAQLKGIDLPDLVGEIVPLGFPLDNLVYQLGATGQQGGTNELSDTDEPSGKALSGKVPSVKAPGFDAAIVPVCQLEQMQAEGLIKLQDYRVLDNQAPVGFHCQVSSRLYPNWSMAKTNRATQSLAKQVTQALLALPEDSPAARAAESAGWTTAVSQLAIDQLLKDLDMHPLQTPWWQRAWQWVKLHQHWAWLVLAILVLLNVYHFWLEYRFSRRGRELINTQRQLSENRALLEHAQRIAIAGELGASLSHELNQPLAAIGHYCHGAEVRLQRGTSPEELQSVLNLIQQEVSRADSIISRLRNLLKKRSVSKQPLYLHQLVNDTAPLLAYELEQHQILLSTNISGEAYPLPLDEVGMQQLLLNLLKNAADACVQRQQSEVDAAKTYLPTIDIDLRYLERKILLTVTDNGTGLTEDANLLMQAFYSTKSEGLGLGLVICRDIAESHGGRFSLETALGGGCQAQVSLPRKLEGSPA
ncbi:PhnD/SsuA/transferrin family substrate-binding protein [Shewanella sp. GD04112]|uniref:sensor histidine kinase n=1 Tax=Shewanella sp. GD04112 TaxID=2975434 RepID=UPI00244C115B|nr:PhnD/SsuA/transferrin family substrate-binding protein [Shewanella sp. GD04112]MDH0447236.1 PhnD/SsuA/transferrin family substrate-binding protein [Shewanella sp. GD04112]